MSPGAPSNVHDVACLTRMNHERNFSWQGQNLVMLEGGFCWSARCNLMTFHM